MVEVLSENQKNSPKNNDTQELTTEDVQMLSHLADLWKYYDRKGLDVRWQAGKVLNDRLGPPTERLEHGQRVLKKVGEELGIAESDLSRMRWFAHYFASVEDFETQHQGKHSWTQVKELLPSLASSRANEQQSEASDAVEEAAEVRQVGEASSAVVTAECLIAPGDAGSPPVVKSLLRTLSNATTKFRQNGLVLAENQREQMLNALRELIEVVSSVSRSA